MKINKSLNIDLNIISPQKHIMIHEGDVDSVDILIGVTVDDESVDLDGVTIKYDATINNYLAEQDADGSVVENKISIPVTQNMTAMSGLLLIDVRMIQNDQILFTQTICATVEKAVVNGSTYIDFDKITIVQRMNALEDKMDYIEELVKNFDTSKLIVSADRPPMGAPAEVDVNLLRVGDTWILSGDNIVYKLVEARYNYSPAPGVEPRHYFTWQPLNERYGVDNTEPPTTVTYQAVVYTINEVQWSWLPVPEYFKGDHYQMQVSGESTYYVCKSGTMRTAGVCTYIWREEGGSVDAYTKAETNALLADKMDLAPLDPTAEQIAAMPNGQLYQDSVNYKGIIKGGQAYYTSEYVDGNYRKVIFHSEYRPPSVIRQSNAFRVGDIWIAFDDIFSHSSPYGTGLHRAYILTNIQQSYYADKNDYFYKWEEITSVPFGESVSASYTGLRNTERLSVRDYGGNLGLCLEKSEYSEGNIIWTDELMGSVHTYRLFIVKTAEYQFIERGQYVDSYQQYYKYQELVIPKQLEGKEDVRNRRGEVSANPSNNYYPSEKCMVDYVNKKIGDIETALSEV